MDGKNVVDVSSFLLFEGSGDSEADCDLNMEAVNKEMDGGDDDDDDDAQSCSYDSCDCTRVMEFDSYDEEEDPHNEEWAGDDDDDDDDDPAGLVKLGGPKKKSSVCVESAMEFMSEMEKNRLFWETCLAS